MSRKPRIGLLGIMQELYDDMIPGITERQGRYAESVAQQLAGVAEVQFPRPARNRDDVEAIARELLADTSGRDVHVPETTEIPARGAALFGAVAAGVYPDIEHAIAATRPQRVRTYHPDASTRSTYDRVYEIYRTLYEMLGRSDVRLLHDLKRIRVERRGA